MVKPLKTQLFFLVKSPLFQGQFWVHRCLTAAPSHHRSKWRRPQSLPSPEGVPGNCAKRTPLSANTSWFQRLIWRKKTQKKIGIWHDLANKNDGNSWFNGQFGDGNQLKLAKNMDVRWFKRIWPTKMMRFDGSDGQSDDEKQKNILKKKVMVGKVWWKYGLFSLQFIRRI